MRAALARSIAHALVPPLCACCGAAQGGCDLVCRRCRGELVPLPGNRCGRCGAPSGREAPSCPECRGRRLSFARAWAAFAYNAACRRLVSALKSRRMVAVARFMGIELAARTPPLLLERADAVVPVPAHARRRLRDGFNPAALVAGHTARAAGLPVLDMLERVGRAPAQAQLGRAERLRVSAGSIAVREAPAPAGRLVLIDDVYTTGATADACATALLRAGAGEVVALAFARAVRQ